MCNWDSAVKTHKTTSKYRYYDVTCHVLRYTYFRFEYIRAVEVVHTGVYNLFEVNEKRNDIVESIVKLVFLTKQFSSVTNRNAS